VSGAARVPDGQRDGEGAERLAAAPGTPHPLDAQRPAAQRLREPRERSDARSWAPASDASPGQGLSPGLGHGCPSGPRQ